MEAFFKPSQSNTENVQLPYLPYYQHSFIPDNEQYLALAGLYRYHLPQARPITLYDVENLGCPERASALQAWLIFGLMSQFYGCYINPRYFTLKNTANQEFVLITEAHQSQLMKQWTASFSEFPTAKRKEIFNGKLRFLKEVLLVSDRMDVARADNLTPDQYWLAEVMLSVRLLLSALYAFAELELQQIPDHDNFFAVHANRVLHSVRSSSLKESILRARMSSSGEKLMIPSQPGAATTFSYLALASRFQRHGWCPIRCQQLCQTYDYAILSYLSRMNQTRWNGYNPHARCLEQNVCTAYNIQKDHYQQTHFPIICSSIRCHPFQIIRTNVVKFISQGKIPLIGIDLRRDDLDPTLISSNGSIPYTAISHVWSDGLGNPRSNSLHMCQLKRIAEILRNMDKQENPKHYKKARCCSSKPKRLYFWMDTLCVPAKIDSDPNTTQVKKIALQYITAIFEAADRTIILDSSLDHVAEKSNHSASLQEEISCRILGGKWIQRAWTLEEGALSRKCYFSFRGTEVLSLGALTPEELTKERKSEGTRKGFWPRMFSRSNYIPLQNNVYEEYYFPLKFLLADLLNEQRKKIVQIKASRRKERKYRSKMNEQFANSWNQLLERSATEPEDLTLIFASLLDLNATKIANLSEDERFPYILRSVPKIPLSLLFNTRNSPLPTIAPCDAWIPAVLAGDELAPNGILTWHGTLRGKPQLKIDLRETESDQIIVVQSQELIPWEMELFCIKDMSQSDSEPLVIDIRGPSTMGGWGKKLRDKAQESHNSGNVSFLIISWELGSGRLNGYSARGARFSCQTEDANGNSDVSLEYDKPFIVWSRKQWELCTGSAELPVNTYKYRVCPKDTTLWLNQGKFYVHASCFQINMSWFLTI
jgi:hypothetical protein